MNHLIATNRPPLGYKQVIAEGRLNGNSNVTWSLEKLGVAATDEAVLRVLKLAKRTPRLLTKEEILTAARA